MADARHFCPDCGSIDLVIKNFGIRDAEGSSLATATCPNCAWSGPLSETIGAVTSEQFWDIERIGNVLLRVITKHAAGPVVQALEFIGLLPKMMTEPDDKIPAEKLKKHNELAQKCRDHVMNSMIRAALEAGFMAAEAANKRYAELMGMDPHPILVEEKTGEQEKVFGGNVAPIERARKQRKRKSQEESRRKN